MNPSSHHSAPSVQCPHCPRKFMNSNGRTQHINSQHRQLTPPPDEERGEEHFFTYVHHQVLTGRPCNEFGEELPEFAPPAAPEPGSGGSWEPFNDRIGFEFAYLHFMEQKSSEAKTNHALDIWAATVLQYDGEVPWKNAAELQATIDEIQHGACPWKTYNIRYEGPLPENPPKWMTATYELCCRDSCKLLHQQVRTPDFKDKINYSPYMQFNADGNRVWSNLMSADWAWSQADKIAAQHPNEAPGAMFIPIVSGSDKTTVSVSTGHQQFHPVYMSPGVITNIARRSHGNGMLPVGFLPIPKVSRHESKDPKYAQFARQLYHACLGHIYEPLKAGMTTPELIRCPDGHLRRAFYGLGPYIADYPEQVYLAGIVQNWCPKCDARPHHLDAPGALRRSHAKTEFLVSAFDPGILWSDYGIRCDYVPFTCSFPRADIHELLSPDLLHQVIKGTFMDHIVAWVYEYLIQEHGETRAKEIEQDIDRRQAISYIIAAVPIFPGLRRFKEGRNFEQWTGDDSKALMKVFLACIVGYVPSEMVQCLSAFLDFCYIARQNSLATTDIQRLEDALARFHQHRNVFIQAGVRIDISPPRQHSLIHYPRSIRLFGSPNGLCSSITESKHIIAVKKPWRVSSRYNALFQMLRRISREEKLDAARCEFKKQGMMAGSALSYTAMLLQGGVPVAPDAGQEDELREEEDLGPSSGPKVLSSIQLSQTIESGYPTELNALAAHINQPHMPGAVRRFLWQKLNPDSDLLAHTVPLDDCPDLTTKIKVHHSAVARFYAPSDLCGAGGMLHERIRSTPLWQNQFPRHDTVFIETDADLPGMRGMVIGRVLLFFSFKSHSQTFSCALVNWLVPHGDNLDPETGLWIVRPEFEGGQRTIAVVDINCIPRAAHLLPIYGSNPLPTNFHFSSSLDVFKAFFVNRYVDHHAHAFLE